MSGMKWGTVHNVTMVTMILLAALIFVVGNASAFVVRGISVGSTPAKDIFSLPQYKVLLGATTTSSLMMGQECGPLPTDGCVVTQNTTFQPGVFDLPNGIRIQASNIFLDCNNALIEGQPTPYAYYYAIRLEGYHDVTIKNCDVISYNYPLYLRNAYGLTIQNNRFSGEGYGGGRVMSGQNVTWSKFIDNWESMDNSYGFDFDRNFSNNELYGNTFYGLFRVNRYYGGDGKNNIHDNVFIGLYDGVEMYGNENIFQQNNVSTWFKTPGKTSRVTNNTFYSQVEVSGTGSHFYDNQIYGYVSDDAIYENVYYCYEGRENTYYGPQGPDCSSDYSPSITELEAAYITAISARISWSTEIHTNSTVSYGTAPDNLSLRAYSENYATSHAVDLRNLTPRTTYYYRGESCTVLDCDESELSNFTTLVYPYCEDGTPFGGCSETKPLFCSEGELIPRCDVCGCSDGKVCPEGIVNASCLTVSYGYEQLVCSDGTFYGSCSETKPLYCDDGELIQKCQQCGCSKDSVCREEGWGAGTCITINYGYEYVPPQERNISFEGTGYVEAWGVGNITAKGTTTSVPNGTLEIEFNGTIIVDENAYGWMVCDSQGTEINGGYQHTGNCSAFLEGENITITVSGTIYRFYAKGIGMVTLTGDGDYRKGKSMPDLLTLHEGDNEPFYVERFFYQVILNKVTNENDPEADIYIFDGYEDSSLKGLTKGEQVVLPDGAVLTVHDVLFKGENNSNNEVRFTIQPPTYTMQEGKAKNIETELREYRVTVDAIVSGPTVYLTVNSESSGGLQEGQEWWLADNAVLTVKSITYRGYGLDNEVTFTLKSPDRILPEGYQRVFDVRGYDYDTSLDAVVSGPRAYFVVNQFATGPLEEGESALLGDGTLLGVRYLIYYGYASEIGNKAIFTLTPPQ